MHRHVPAPLVSIVSLVCFAILVSAAPAMAQTWSFRLSGAGYFLPDEDNYLQPTIAADRDALHLESRYHYEAAGSLSIFAGWNLSFGKNVKVELTPMFGGLFGESSGVIPALEGDLTWRRLEFYSEAEFVIDLGNTSDHFAYAWSEFSIWPTEWLRAGAVLQRTRAYQSPRELQRGVLIGASGSTIEGAFYVFNPGADDHFYVVSIGVKF